MRNAFRGPVAEFLRERYIRLDRISHGCLGILVDTVVSFSQARAGVTAASLAFYGVFSLFPLLALWVALISFWIPQGQLLRFLLDFLKPIFPVSGSLISDSLQRFIDSRGTISVVGFLGLLWSASNVFTILVHMIDTAWERAHLRSFIQNRLVALGLVAGGTGLFGFFWLGSRLLGILAVLDVPPFDGPSLYNSLPWRLITDAVPPLVAFGVLLSVYRWVPNTRVRFSEAFWGAFVVTVLWELTGAGFSWYIGFGLGAYDLLYGPLSALAILMVWFYINFLTLLFGAFLSARIALRRQRTLELEMHARAGARHPKSSPGTGHPVEVEHDRPR